MNKDNDMRHLKQPTSRAEVAALRVGDLVGDGIGGKSFGDDVAQALEQRGNGWHTIWGGPGMTRWTTIRIVK